jgi:hypothetical protein
MARFGHTGPLFQATGLLRNDTVIEIDRAILASSNARHLA